MAQDMWTAINRELEKVQRARGGVSATPVLDEVGDIVKYAMQDKERKEINYAREIATVNAFETKLDRQIENATRSGAVYSDAEISDVRESIKSIYNTDSDRFSSLRSEFTDSLESRLNTLAEFSTRNKEWNTLEREAPIAVDNLLKLTGELAETEWDDLSQDNKLNFKDRLMDQTQRVAELKRILKDPYNQSRMNYTQLGANIEGIANGKLSLLTQLGTFDPGQVVITDGEMQAMTQAIKNNDPSLIATYNNEGLKMKAKRIGSMEAKVEQSVREYDKLVEFYSSPDFQTAKKLKSDELKELVDKGKAIPDDFWEVPMPDGTVVNLKEEIKEKRKRIDDANDVDESYRRENLLGASYKESYDVKFPWDVNPPATPEDILKGKKTILDLPQVIGTEAEEGKGLKVDAGFKLDRKSFGNIVNYASKLDNKKDIYNLLLDNKIPNYYYLTKTIVNLRNIEQKYGKESNEYQQTFNRAKKSYDTFSFIPYFDETVEDRDKEHKEKLKRKKAGAVR